MAAATCPDGSACSSLASLYEAFPLGRAKRLANKLEIQYAPKHGNWPTMAELELNAPHCQCLNRRMADHTTLDPQLGNWVKSLNVAVAAIR